MTAIETQWSVITGVLSSSTTKTGEALAFLGQFVIPEAARVLIDADMSSGKTLQEIREDEFNFQQRVLEMKMAAEERLSPEQSIVLVRGIPDTIAYDRFNNFDPTNGILASVERRYKNIFLLDPLAVTPDYARIENDEDVSSLHKLLYQSYSDLGYSVVQVPVMPIMARAHFILDKING